MKKEKSNNAVAVVITGIGLHLKEARSIDDLFRLNINENKIYNLPENKVGKKGLRYKDFATKIALCSSYECLLDAKLISEDNIEINSNAIGIVISSNFGNVDSVAISMNTIKESHVNRTNALLLPNLSSNIIASSLAIKYRISGPNITICNGDTSGLSAIQVGVNLIEAGRANQVLIVGSEPENDFVNKLLKSDISSRKKIGEGSFALLLEKALYATKRNAKIYSEVIYSNLSNSILYIKNEMEKLDDKDLIISNLSKEDIKHYRSNFLNLEDCFGWLKGSEGILSCIYASIWLKYNKGKILILSGEENDISSIVISEY